MDLRVRHTKKMGIPHKKSGNTTQKKWEYHTKKVGIPHKKSGNTTQKIFSIFLV